MNRRRTDPGFDQVRDAARRTRLANERTYLAWWRTGLTSLAVALGVGKLVPGLTDSNHWPYAVIGGGFAALGMVCIGYGARRAREVDDAVAAGGYVPMDDRLATLMALAGVLLGVLTFLLVVGIV